MMVDTYALLLVDSLFFVVAALALVVVVGFFCRVVVIVVNQWREGCEGGLHEREQRHHRVQHRGSLQGEVNVSKQILMYWKSWEIYEFNGK